MNDKRRLLSRHFTFSRYKQLSYYQFQEFEILPLGNISDDENNFLFQLSSTNEYIDNYVNDGFSNETVFFEIGTQKISVDLSNDDLLINGVIYNQGVLNHNSFDNQLIRVEIRNGIWEIRYQGKKTSSRYCRRGSDSVSAPVYSNQHRGVIVGCEWGNATSCPITLIKYNDIHDGVSKEIVIRPYLDGYTNKVVFANDDFSKIFYIYKHEDNFALKSNEYIELGNIYDGVKYQEITSGSNKYKRLGRIQVVYKQNSNAVDGAIITAGTDKYSLSSTGALTKNGSNITSGTSATSVTGRGITLQKATIISGTNFDNAAWYGRPNASEASKRYFSSGSPPWTITNVNLYVGDKDGSNTCTCQFYSFSVCHYFDNTSLNKESEYFPYYNENDELVFRCFRWNLDEEYRVTTV